MKEESSEMVSETWIRSIKDNASMSQTLLVTTERKTFVSTFVWAGILFQNPFALTMSI